MAYRFIILFFLCFSYVSCFHAMISSGCLSFSQIIPCLRECFFSEGLYTELQSSHVESCVGRAPLWEQIWWGKMTGPIKLLNTTLQDGCLDIAYSNGTIQRCLFSHKIINNFVDYRITADYYSYKQCKAGCLFCALEGSVFCKKDDSNTPFVFFKGVGHVLSDNEIIIADASGFSFFNTKEFAEQSAQNARQPPIEINPQNLICYKDLKHIIVAGEKRGVLLYDQRADTWSMLSPQGRYSILLKASLGNSFAAVAEDGRIVLWSYHGDWSELKIFYLGVPIEVAALVDEHYLIIGYNKTFLIYSFENSDICATYSIQMTGKIVDIVLSEDAQSLAISTSCNKVTLWKRADYYMVSYRL